MARGKSVLVLGLVFEFVLARRVRPDSDVAAVPAARGGYVKPSTTKSLLGLRACERG